MVQRSESLFSLSNLRRGLLLAAIISLGYFIPNNFVIFPTHQVVLTRFDHWIELQPAWVWFYVSYYPLLILAYFMTTANSAQRVYFGAMSLAAVVGFVVFLFFPTMISRELYPWHGANDWSARMLAHIRGADLPVNCLPSMHVCMSFIAASCISLVRRWVGRVLVWAWFFAICYSTMATKQHYFVDVVAGFALGITTVGIFMRRYDLLPDFRELMSQPGPFKFSTPARSGSPLLRSPRVRSVVAKLRRRG